MSIFVIEVSAVLQQNQSRRLTVYSAYTLAILLGHLKLPHEEIKRAVLSMDETTLCEAHIKQLLLYAPDHKEVCIIPCLPQSFVACKIMFAAPLCSVYFSVSCIQMFHLLQCQMYPSISCTPCYMQPYVPSIPTIHLLQCFMHTNVLSTPMSTVTPNFI